MTLWIQVAARAPPNYHQKDGGGNTSRIFLILVQDWMILDQTTGHCVNGCTNIFGTEASKLICSELGEFLLMVSMVNLICSCLLSHHHDTIQCACDISPLCWTIIFHHLMLLINISYYGYPGYDSQVNNDMGMLFSSASPRWWKSCNELSNREHLNIQMYMLAILVENLWFQLFISQPATNIRAGKYVQMVIFATWAFLKICRSVYVLT